MICLPFSLLLARSHNDVLKRAVLQEQRKRAESDKALAEKARDNAELRMRIEELERERWGRRERAGSCDAGGAAAGGDDGGGGGAGGGREETAADAPVKTAVNREESAASWATTVGAGGTTVNSPRQVSRLAAARRRLRAVESTVPHLRQLACWGDSFTGALSELLSSRAPGGSSAAGLLAGTLSMHGEHMAALVASAAAILASLRRRLASSTSAVVTTGKVKNEIIPAGAVQQQGDAGPLSDSVGRLAAVSGWIMPNTNTNTNTNRPAGRQAGRQTDREGERERENLHASNIRIAFYKFPESRSHVVLCSYTCGWQRGGRR